MTDLVTSSGSHRVGDIIPSEDSRQILLLTTWRSGSTFTGDLLNQYPGTFYYFEPLHYYANRREQDVIQSEETFLKSLFQCSFNRDNFGYLQHVAQWANSFLFKNHNFRLWNSCKNVLPLNTMCFLPEFLSFSCKLHPIKLIKTVRIRLGSLTSLFSDPKMNLKVILLVRDPRGVFNSRSSEFVSAWCRGEECASPTKTCRDLRDDLVAAKLLEKHHPGRVTVIRYEDLSLEPELLTRRLLKFLSLPWTEAISQFIRTHTISSEPEESKKNIYTKFITIK